jgi:uncharacterized protein YndB with AHSA1/START domain
MIDISQHINTVRRQVGTRVLEAGEARTVTIIRTYATDVEDVWDACTNPERIARWFMPIECDLRLNGRYQLQGNAGGTIERCDPPRSFAATWEYGGDVSWIEVRLSPAEAGATRFELEHIAHVDDARWSEFGPGAVGVGWDLGLMGLSLHLVGGGSLSPSEGAAWQVSEAGKQFVTLSSARWCEASIASGTDAAAAQAAADRTTAAYTATG